MGPGLLKLITEELAGAFTGAVVSKVHQVSERDLYIKLFTRGRQETLVVSTDPKCPRIHLVEEKPPSPPRPLRFCALLRSRITDARIESITQEPGERIVRVELVKGGFEKGGVLIPEDRFTLTIELIGKSGNVILTDEGGVVIDALRRFPAGESMRAVEPGVKLVPLPPPVIRAGEVREEKLIDRAEGETWNEAARRYYEGVVGGELDRGLRSELKRAIKKAEKKVKRKLRNLEGDRSKAEGKLGGTRLGELLVANYGTMKRGMKDITVDDYYKDPPEKIIIELNPKYGPQDNIDRLFKAAKKAKTTLKLLEKRLPPVERELEYIEGLFVELEMAAGDDDLGAIREELIEVCYLKVRPVTMRRTPVVADPVRRFTSVNGFEIMCGKSGPGNDLIVKKHGKSGDLWFHVQGMAGSHALLKKGKGELPAADVTEAAAVAAWYSKARESSRVEVIVADAKAVKKPRGAKPGMVVVRDYKTVNVRPALPPESSGEDNSDGQ